MLNYNKYNNKKKNNNKVVFIILFLIFVIIFSFVFKNSNNSIINKTASYVTMPFEHTSIFFTNMYKGITDNFKNSNDLKIENDNMKKELDELKYQLLEIEKLKNENESLKKMLEISKEYKSYNLKYASIIYRDNDNFSDSFNINLGKNDGIKLNQTVIYKDGLIGYISKVYDNVSVVTTILNPNSAVSVTISTINEPAILKGDLKLKSKNELKLEYIPIDTQISIGDVVYTSGLTNKYVSDIPVGKINSIINNENDIDRYAIVTSFVDIFNISEVAIIVES